MLRFGLFIAGGLFSVSLLYAANVRAEIVEEVAVVVNDDVILRGELIELIEPYKQSYLSESGRQRVDDRFLAQARMLVEEVIMGRLLFQEASKQGVEIEDSRIDEAVKEDQAKFASEEEFRNALADKGKTVATWRERKMESLLAEKFTALKLRQLRRDVTISEQEIQEYYEKQGEELSGEPSQLSDVRAEIESRLRAGRVREKFNDWLRKLRENARVEKYFRWSDILK